MSDSNSAISSVLSAKQSAVDSQLAALLAAKQLQAAKQQGAAAVKLLETAAQIGKAPGSGAQFDGSV